MYDYVADKSDEDDPFAEMEEELKEGVGAFSRRHDFVGLYRPFPKFLSVPSLRY